MTDRVYCVYILTNDRHTVLYTGVTGDLKKRVWQHREHVVDGFSKQYGATQLVYYDVCSDPRVAIAREKQIKAGSRRRKIELINAMNPEWRDLYHSL